LTGYDHRLKLFGPLPSFQENISVLDVLRRQLACTAIPSEPPYEQRYPYLDRGLLEFIYAIPRRQLVRPGQRRSLMRRALLGMVPDEILNRKRKAFVVRSPMTSISKEWDTLAEMSRHMVMASLGIIDSTILAEALDNARNGKEGPIVPLIRTVGIEHWLNTLIHQLPDSRTRIHFPGLPCVATKKSGKACHQKTLLASN
jgi:asparagine synthetase B (glutamine-hydrolysing)